ncbi:MAG: GMC family oxidoreductase N-terminal domain-containing protein [Halovenus sp.]
MQNHYDYIVVGAGSAGCILADRLTEDDRNDVLLLEAGGPDDKEEIKTPMAFGGLLKTDVDWNYMSTPQQQLKGRQAYHPRGKVIGGSSSLNAMIYFRGHPWDYDHWAELGNEGWSFDEMLPYFKKAEDFAGGESEYRNTGGKLHIKKQPNTTGLSEHLLEAAQEVGYEWNDDLNAGEMEGIGQTQVNIKDGQRHSTADAYLRPALSRHNLEAETGARVTSLRFDGEQVVGVTLEQDGQEYEVDANEEVILSGGVFGSPHLLLLSGVGHSAQLQEHDIDVVTHLPGVGKNLQDHLMGVLTYESAQSFELPPSEHMTQNIAFERDDPDNPTPDLVIFLINALFMNHGFDNPEGTQGYTIAFHMTYPESEGELTLRSADPLDEPRIDFKYLSDSRDLDRLVQGLKRAREIGEADPLDEYRGEELWPGEDVQTDEEIADYLRETTQTGYHPIGTCKMGTDDMAVVDNRLRVKGVHGLRVVDASVMPYISVANTQGAVIGVAERAADMIKEDA